MSTWTKPRAKGSCWATPIVDAPPLYTPPAASKPDPFLIDLPLGQKMVLLKLRKGELAAAILEKLKAMSAPEPVKADWSACIAASYIRRSFAHSNTGRLELLPPGLSVVNAIMRDLARKYDVHQITFHFKLPRSNMGSFASCSCGGWTQTVTRKRGDDDRLRGYAAEHLDQVARGTWKRPRPMEEFLNQYMPLQLPFSGTTGPEKNPGADVASVSATAPGRL